MKQKSDRPTHYSTGRVAVGFLYSCTSKVTIIRMFVRGLILLSLLFIGLSAGESLYVFYPSILNSDVIEEKIGSVLKGVNVIAFSKYDDFKVKMSEEPPDVVLTKEILINDQFDLYEIYLRGERNGSTKEKYVILSNEKGFSVDSVGSTTVIGVIDILGRAGMNKFVQQFFPVEPRVKRVSRIADLLSLLSLNAASGVIIEKAFVEYVISSSHMKISVTNLKGQGNGIVACAVKKGKEAKNTIVGLKKNDPSICRLFYIDCWR